MSEFVKDHWALKWRAGSAVHEDDHLAVEEPLEIRFGGRRFTLTMRTPGHDEELAAGFLLAEGFIDSHGELGEIRRPRDSSGRQDPNVIDIILNVPSAGLRERLRRNFNISSSCGVCGKTSIEALQRRIAPLHDGTRIPAASLFGLPTLMREAQAVFSATGGLHAAALFDLCEPANQSFVYPLLTLAGSFAGEGKGGGSDSDEASAPSAKYKSGVRLIVLREDVGRHNAVDKVIGCALLRCMLPLQHSAMMVSGRLSFELVQKAAAAGISILCAVSAPSSLAVELAEEVGMTLVGFLREPNFNVYTGEDRILC
jgi:FdhD protein